MALQMNVKEAKEKLIKKNVDIISQLNSRDIIIYYLESFRLYSRVDGIDDEYKRTVNFLISNGLLNKDKNIHITPLGVQVLEKLYMIPHI